MEKGDTVVLFSQGGAGENDIRLDCFFEGIALRQRKAKPPGLRTNSLRTPNEFEAQVVPDFALVGLKSARRALSPSA